MRTKSEVSRRVMWLMAAVYCVSYITRLSYSTVFVEIIDATGFSKAMASLPLTGLAIAYGVGQLISGFAGDRVQPKRLVGLGLAVTACMNVLLPLCVTPAQMVAVWSVNGLAQAFMWPPLVKLMSDQFDEAGYARACALVSNGGHVGHVALYLFAPVLMQFAGWKSLFYTAAATAVAVLAVWMMQCPRITMERRKISGGGHGPVPWSGMLIAILAAIILMGMLRDGVTAWMPSLISETFDLGNRVSILSGVVLPLFAILSIAAASTIRRRWMKNELKLSAILFAVCLLSTLLLGFCRSRSPILTILLLGLLASSMNGVNLMLLTFVPRQYAGTGAVSLISGLLNSCTYAGAALSTYTFAVASENFGWTATIFFWAGIALAGTLLCVSQIKGWHRMCASMAEEAAG